MATEKTYSGDGSDTTFDITFPYLTHADIKVFLKELKSGATAPYDANDYHYVNKSDPGDYSISGNTVTFTTAPADGTTGGESNLLKNNIKITRATVITSPEHEYSAGSSITAAKLNENQKQALYAIQEAGEITATPGGISTGDKGPIFVSSDSSWAMQANSIANTHLQDNAVDTAEIKANAVTMDKLNSGALPTDITVDHGNIVADAIRTAEIKDSEITLAKLATAVANSLNPVGTVIWFAGSTPPKGYLKANGDTIQDGNTSISGNDSDGDAIGTVNTAALFAITGATLPDLRGEFVRGFDDGKGTDNGRSIRSTQADQNKSHSHTAAAVTDFTGTIKGISESFASSGTASGAFSKGGSFTCGATPSGSSDNGNCSQVAFDGNHSHTIADDGGTEARPRNIALLACIKY